MQNKEVPNGTLVLGEPWADVTKSYPGSGTNWEDCDKYARCGNFGELKRLKAKYPHLKQLFPLVAGLGLTAFLIWPLMKNKKSIC